MVKKEDWPDCDVHARLRGETQRQAHPVGSGMMIPRREVSCQSEWKGGFKTEWRLIGFDD